LLTETRACFAEVEERFAPKWCKPLQGTEKSVVSPRETAIFHRLINTCVENFTEQKYGGEVSERHLQRCATVGATKFMIGKSNGRRT
jgi:hypothetical protein